MMNNLYSENLNAQIVVSLLKQYNIRKVVASPGTMNIAIVGSMQHDSFFEMYSCVDERSAAYMACGLSSASGEPVVITCTEATASRNYMPGLTEAFYRQLPIVVITGTRGIDAVGHLFSQVIDRSQRPKDIVKCSVYLKAIKDKKDYRTNILYTNKALGELNHHGKGPVHIDIMAGAGSGFTIKELPVVPIIRRFQKEDPLPYLPMGKIVVFIGSHEVFSQNLSNALDNFCSVHNSLVFGDHTSGYKGKYFVNYNLVCAQKHYTPKFSSIETVIHIGEISGSVYTTNALKPKHTWRISEDGQLRDTFGTLQYVFEMKEIDFFNAYSQGEARDDSFLNACINEVTNIESKIPELEFGNIWIAKEISKSLPLNCTIHFAINNSLRSWNFFNFDRTIIGSSNVGGYGIDGAMSTLLGASLANPDRIHFLCVGDLAFFYDLNVLGNRHFGNNIRVLIINNGRGIEFRKKDHPAFVFGDEADKYIAAGGHFGNQSPDFIKNIATSIGLKYLSASNKKDFTELLPIFVNPNISESVIFEIFTNVENEVESLDRVRNLATDGLPFIDSIKDGIKKEMKSVISEVKKRL